MANPSDYDETQPPAEEPEAYPQDPAYDPGSALVEENPSFAAPAGEGAYYDPNQAVYDPSGAYAEGAYPSSEAAPTAPDETGASGVYDEAPAPPPAVSRPAAKKKVVKKKVVKKGAVRPSAARPGAVRPGVRRPAPRPATYGGGISPVTVLLVLVALGMLAAIVMVGLPKDLSAVAGYPPGITGSGKPRNLVAEVQQAMVDRSTALTFTEEEVNQYLGQRLAGEQKGALASLVKFRGVCIDFSPEKAEVVIEREIFGLPLTMGVDLVAEEFRRQMVYKPTKWHIGRISLGARTVKPVADLFTRLRGSLQDEYQSLLQMSSVRFEENQVVLDSRI